MHRCLVAVCCSVGWKIEVDVLNMICTWKELLWVVTWHMTCVLYCCCRETISRGILLSQHTHIGFPLSTICGPVVSPSSVLGYQLVTECWLLLPPRSFQLRFFAFFATNEQSPWHLVPRRDTGSPRLDNCFLWKDQQMERATPKFSCLVALQLLHITFSTH
jgi:hypothetical protein